MYVAAAAGATPEWDIWLAVTEHAPFVSNLKAAQVTTPHKQHLQLVRMIV
jgi:hypothetical protein